MRLNEPEKPEVSPPTIPDHELLRSIGRGSYGEVWLAKNRSTGVYRAVKVVRRRSFEQDRPFEREFAGLCKFEPVSRSHDGLMDVLHVGRDEAEGLFYAVMELADDRKSGQEIEPGTYEPKTLRSEIQERGRIPFEECLELGLSLAQAIGQMHKHGLVHRDIKPSNIIFIHGTPKLADIGLVTDLDATCSFVGTEGYVPPEGPGTRQADLYALGKVVYETSTGQHRSDYPQLPAGLKDFPDRQGLLELNEVVVKACERSPAERYRSAEEMLGDIELLRDGKSVRRRRLLAQRRFRLKWIGALASTVLLLGAAAWELRGGSSGQREPAFLEKRGRHLEVRDNRARLLWPKELEGEVSSCEVVDLDGEGHKDVLVATLGLEQNENVLNLYNRAGTLKWRYFGPTNSHYLTLPEPMFARDFVIIPRTKEKAPRIAVQCVNSQFQKPGCVALLDSKGNELALYWNPGNILWMRVASATTRSQPKLVVAAINNDLRAQYGGSEATNVYCLFALDPERVAGEAPPYKGGGARGTHEWYGVFQPAGNPIKSVNFTDVNADGKKEICVTIAADKVYLTFEGKFLTSNAGDRSLGPVTFELIRD